MKLIALSSAASVLLSLSTCKSSNRADELADLEAAGGKKVWSCVGKATIDGKTPPELVRISIFGDGSSFTQVQLYKAASGASSTWKPSDTSIGKEDSSTLTIAQWKLVGGGAKAITDGNFYVKVNKTKKAKGPEYSRFPTFSNMDGFQADVTFKSASVISSWVQVFETKSEDWVCSNLKQYL